MSLYHTFANTIQIISSKRGHFDQQNLIVYMRLIPIEHSENHRSHHDDWNLAHAVSLWIQWSNSFAEFKLCLQITHKIKTEKSPEPLKTIIWTKLLMLCGLLWEMCGFSLSLNSSCLKYIKYERQRQPLQQRFVSGFEKQSENIYLRHSWNWFF